MDVNDLLEYAIKTTDDLLEGEVFLLKNLFKGYEWNRLAVKDRHLLGILFLNYVNSKESGLMVIEKTSSHQQRYQKVSES